MKPLLFTLLAAAGVVAPLSAQTTTTTTYTSFIRQTQQPTGVVWDLPVTAVSGSAASVLGLDTTGSLYQLYAVASTGSSYLLDQKLVGAYLPTANVITSSLDPYAPVTRTRADKPFTITMTVGNLVTGTTTSGGTVIPDAAKKVLIQRYTTNYATTAGTGGGTTNILTDVLTSITSTVTSVASTVNYTLSLSQALTGTPKSTSYITSNGTTATTYAVTGLTPLTGQASTKVSGEEWYVVQALADSSVAQTQIASGHVQILPVATATIAGIANGDQLKSRLPDIKLTYQDSYPSSTTWLQAYPGNAALGTNGTTVPGTTLVLDQANPDTRTITVSNWDSVLNSGDGNYTIEVLTNTVYGTERLSYVTFNVKRTLNVVGNFTDIAN